MKNQPQSCDNNEDKNQSPENALVKLRKYITIDGKDVRGLQAHLGEVVNVVILYALGFTMRTQLGHGKGHEIGILRNALNSPNLKEYIITLDVLHCQSETINATVKQKATTIIHMKVIQSIDKNNRFVKIDGP